MGLNNTRISYALIATLSITSMPVAVIEAQQASEGAARLMETRMPILAGQAGGNPRSQNWPSCSAIDPWLEPSTKMLV